MVPEAKTAPVAAQVTLQGKMTLVVEQKFGLDKVMGIKTAWQFDTVCVCTPVGVVTLTLTALTFAFTLNVFAAVEPKLPDICPKAIPLGDKTCMFPPPLKPSPHESFTVKVKEFPTV